MWVVVMPLDLSFSCDSVLLHLLGVRSAVVLRWCPGPGDGIEGGAVARDDVGDCRTMRNMSRKAVRVYDVSGGASYVKVCIDIPNALAIVIRSAQSKSGTTASMIPCPYMVTSPGISTSFPISLLARQGSAAPSRSASAAAAAANFGV